jgi:hypothetical protein
MIITVALFGGALVCIIALLVYALWQQADIIQQLGELQREVGYVSRVVVQYDKRESQKQHIRMRPDEPVAHKAPPVEVRKARGVPDADLTVWGAEI